MRAYALTLRTKWIKLVKGGVSGVTRSILRAAFIGEKSVAIAGVNLPLTTIGVIVNILFEAILADEEALNAMFFTKGASGILPCLGCNVVSKPLSSDRDRGIAALSERDPEIVDISCPDIHRIGLRSDEDVWHICNELEEASRHPDKKVLAELENCTGIKLNLDTLLFDKELRRHVGPARALTMDPMHIMFSNGLLGAEMMLFARQLEEDHACNVFVELRAIGKAWKPETLIFNETREKSSEKSSYLKAGASELLSGYPLMRRFILEAYGASPPELHVRSILLLFQICDDFRLLNKHLPDAEKEVIRTHLRSLVREYLVAFKAAHGIESVVFKHHQLLHWVEQRPQLSCFCLERKHITAKKCVQNTTKLQHVAKGGLYRMMNQQVRMLENPGWGSALGKSSNDFPEMARSLGARGVLISGDMNYKGVTMKHGQVVFMDPAKTYLIVIVACLGIDDKFGLVVRKGQRVSCTEFDSVWQMPAEVQIMHLDNGNVFPVAFWKYLSSDRLEVLH
jgi:hypothetical protein